MQWQVPRGGCSDRFLTTVWLLGGAGRSSLAAEADGTEGARLSAESIRKGARPYVLNPHPLKDTNLNVLFCSPPGSFEPSPSPRAFKCFLRINASHSIFHNTSRTLKWQSEVKHTWREREGKAIFYPSPICEMYISVNM